MNVKQILTIYNRVLQSHKALPNDTEKRLAQGETIILVNGTESNWTSKLVLTKNSDEIHAKMILAENLPERIKAQLEEKRKVFEKEVHI